MSFYLKRVHYMEITAWTENNGLQLIVTERPRRLEGLQRFYATIDDVHIKESETAATMTSILGNGSTIGAAMDDLAKQISGKLVVAFANKPSMFLMKVPELINTVKMEET